MIKVYIDIKMLHKDGKVFKAAVEVIKKWLAKGYEITIEKDDQEVPKEIKKFKPKKKIGSILEFDLIIAKNAVGNQICSNTWWQYFDAYDIATMIRYRTENEISGANNDKDEEE